MPCPNKFNHVEILKTNEEVCKRCLEIHGFEGFVDAFTAESKRVTFPFELKMDGKARNLLFENLKEKCVHNLEVNPAVISGIAEPLATVIYNLKEWHIKILIRGGHLDKLAHYIVHHTVICPLQLRMLIMRVLSKQGIDCPKVPIIDSTNSIPEPSQEDSDEDSQPSNTEDDLMTQPNVEEEGAESRRRTVKIKRNLTNYKVSEELYQNARSSVLFALSIGGGDILLDGKNDEMIKSVAAGVPIDRGVEFQDDMKAIIYSCNAVLFVAGCIRIL